jgi:hypothetical protein
MRHYYYKNRKGQLGKTISTFFVMIGVLIIMVFFVYVTSYIGNPHSITNEEIGNTNILGKTLIIDSKEFTILEGLFRYQEEELSTLFPFDKPGFKENFAKSLAIFVEINYKDVNYPVCLAYSLEKGYEKRRLFIVYDKEAGKEFIYVTDKYGEKKADFRGALNILANEGISFGALGDVASIKGDGEETEVSKFVKLVKYNFGKDIMIGDLPRISLNVDEKKFDIYYYYGRCKGGAL